MMMMPLISIDIIFCAIHGRYFRIGRMFYMLPNTHAFIRKEAFITPHYAIFAYIRASILDY